MYKARRTHLQRLQAVVDDIKHELPDAQRAPVQAAADVLIHVAQPPDTAALAVPERAALAVPGTAALAVPGTAATVARKSPRPKEAAKPSLWTQAASAVSDTYEQKKRQYEQAKTLSGFMNSDFSFF